MSNDRLDLLKRHGLNPLDLDLRILDAMEEYAASRISELEAENQQLEIKVLDMQDDRSKLREAEHFIDLQKLTLRDLEAENKRLREEIEAQQVEIVKKDEQLDNHRWIPVTERLPETSDDYAEQVIGLSSAPGTEVPYVVICVAFYDGHFYVLDTFSEIDFSEPLDVVEHQIKTITHWQPLPQPPKEQ